MKSITQWLYQVYSSNTFTPETVQHVSGEILDYVNEELITLEEFGLIELVQGHDNMFMLTGPGKRMGALMNRDYPENNPTESWTKWESFAEESETADRVQENLGMHQSMEEEESEADDSCMPYTVITLHMKGKTMVTEFEHVDASRPDAATELVLENNKRKKNFYVTGVILGYHSLMDPEAEDYTEEASETLASNFTIADNSSASSYSSEALDPIVEIDTDGDVRYADSGTHILDWREVEEYKSLNHLLSEDQELAQALRVRMDHMEYFDETGEENTRHHVVPPAAIKYLFCNPNASITEVMAECDTYSSLPEDDFDENDSGFENNMSDFNTPSGHHGSLMI